VNPNGSDTSYAFEYGTTAAFAKTTVSESAGSGTSPVSVSVNVTGLKANTNYDFALVATSALGTVTGATQSFQTEESSCVAQAQVVSQDVESLRAANDTLAADRLNAGATVAADRQSLASDQQALTVAEQALSADEATATNSNSTFTALPSIGEVISRGQSVYSLDRDPVPLFYGSVAPYRALYLGVSDGPDVTELEENLIALGFEHGSASDQFTYGTEADVKAWQASLGEAENGVVALGDVVVEPGPIEVDTVPVSTGAAASPGTAVLTATSTTREVTIDLDADQQSEVKVGDPVSVTLPDNDVTPGVVSSVGTVATSPPSSSSTTGGGSSPTITVEVTLTDPGATGDLDQAPVTVAITNASVSNAFVVPVDALLALSSGGYALEVIGSNGVHQFEAVNLGLFDDADGLVQVSGPGVAVGQKIVVPNT